LSTSSSDGEISPRAEISDHSGQYFIFEQVLSLVRGKEGRKLSSCVVPERPCYTYSTRTQAREVEGKLPTGGAILKILGRHVDIGAALETVPLRRSISARGKFYFAPEREGGRGEGKAGRNSKAKMTKSRRKIVKLPAASAAQQRPPLSSLSLSPSLSLSLSTTAEGGWIYPRPVYSESRDLAESRCRFVHGEGGSREGAKERISGEGLSRFRNAFVGISGSSFLLGRWHDLSGPGYILVAAINAPSIELRRGTKRCVYARKSDKRERERGRGREEAWRFIAGLPGLPGCGIGLREVNPLPLPSPITRISPAPAGIGLATLLRRHTRTARHAIVTRQIVKSVIEDRRPPAQRSGGTDLASE